MLENCNDESIHVNSNYFVDDSKWPQQIITKKADFWSVGNIWNWIHPVYWPLNCYATQALKSFNWYCLNEIRVLFIFSEMLTFPRTWCILHNQKCSRNTLILCDIIVTNTEDWPLKIKQSNISCFHGGLWRFIGWVSLHAMWQGLVNGIQNWSTSIVVYYRIMIIPLQKSLLLYLQTHISLWKENYTKKFELDLIRWFA